MKKILLIQLILFQTLGVLAQVPAESMSRKWFRFDESDSNLKQDNRDEKKLLGLGALDELKVISISETSTSKKHIRQQQYYQGVPVNGAILISHKKNGRLQSANGQLVENISLNINPNITKETALNLVLDHINAVQYAWESQESEQLLKDAKVNHNATFYPEGKLVVYTPDFQATTAKLAYEFEIYALEPHRRIKLFIDANTGDILSEIDLIHQCTEPCDIAGTGETEYYGNRNITCLHNPWNNKFFLKEIESREIETRNGNRQNAVPSFNLPDFDLFGFHPHSYFPSPLGYDYENNSSNWGNEDPIALGVHWASEQFYDYFATIFNWDSYDNQGSKIINVVHYGQHLDNAFWNGAWASYGDGHGSNNSWTSLDVVAHEISHGLIQSTANLTYYGESGALNESFADIFAVLVENHTLGNDSNWTIGEDITGTVEGFRDMSEFMEYQGTGWYNGSGDNGGVHINSGVQNHWFYLLSDEIGMAAAAQICFHSLTNYLTPYSNYQDAKNASIQAALDLFDQDTADIVCAKWNEVGLSNNCQEAGNITITTPMVGDILIVNNPSVISWTKTVDISHVNIEYVLNSSADWQSIANNIPDTSYTWNIPELDSNNNIFIKISDAGNNAVTDIIGPILINECPTTAAFDESINHTCIGNSISFNNTSLNATNYEWWINGTFHSTDVHLDWTSDILGEVEIELRAIQNTFGCYQAISKEVFVVDSTDMVAEFTYLRQGTDILFSVSNLDPYANYSWNFGDGEAGSLPEMYHTYAVDSLYEVCLTVENDCVTSEHCMNLIMVSSLGQGGLCSQEWDHYVKGPLTAMLEIGDYVWAGFYGGGLVKISKIDGAKEYFYSWNSGLPNNNISALLEASNGDIWIGTLDEGLVKYDGTNWTVLGLPSVNVNNVRITTLMEDSSGKIWIGTDDGKVVTVVGNSWTQYNYFNSGLPNQPVNTIIEDYNGYIWIGTGGGLLKFDGISTWQIFYPNNSGASDYVYALLQDSYGIIWIGTTEGMASYNPVANTWGNYFIDNFYLPNSNCLSLKEDSSGSIWVGTHGAVTRISGAGAQWDSFNGLNSNANSSVLAILEDASGKMWMETNKDGDITTFNGLTWGTIDIFNSDLPNNNITGLTKDSIGNIWIAGGISKYDGQTWKVFNPSNSNIMSSEALSVIVDASNNTWIGDSNGHIAKFDGTTWTTHNLPSANQEGLEVVSLLEDSFGNIWAGTSTEGVFRFNGNSWTIYNALFTGLPDNNVQALLEDSNGNIWVGTSSGLIKYNGGNWTIYNYIGTGLTTNDVLSLLEDSNGNIWVGTAGKLAKFDGNYWAAFDSSTANAPYYNTSLLEDSDGNLWIGTHDGLTKYDGTSFELFDTSNSNLSSNTILSLLEDAIGNIWIGTNEGINIILQSISTKFQSHISCSQDTSFFENTSRFPTESEWRINGEIVSQEIDLNYYFAESGNYEITLVASNDNGCADIYSESVTIPATANELDGKLPEYLSVCGSSAAVLDLNSQNYSSYEWVNSLGFVVNTTPTFSTSEAGLYHLSIIDFCGESATDSIWVIIGEDCVWPGDTNKDGIVNHHDLISIGLAYDASGSSRLGGDLTWRGQASLAWSNLDADGIDFKHMDTDGNALIDAVDKEVILNNYGKTNISSTSNLYPPSVHSSYSLIPVFEGLDSDTRTLQLSVDIQSDDDLYPPFYGLAFRLEYESSSIFDTYHRPLEMNMDVLGSDAISIHRQFPTYTDMAFVGTNHQNRNITINQGVTTSLQRRKMVHFTIGDVVDLPGGDSSRYLRIIPRDILMVNNVGDVIPTKGKELNVYLPDEDLSFIIISRPITCDSLGSITVQPTNLGRTYSYLWDTGETTATLIAPSTGIHRVTVTDNDSGDEWQGLADIQGLEGLEMEIQDDGTQIHALVNGGDGNYLYSWNNGEITPSINRLGSTNYEVTVMDGNGCFTNASFFILPVELLGFAGREVDNTTHLEWTTLSEKDSDYFIIEHSQDGFSFQEIGEVRAAGYSTEQLVYNFTHGNPTIGINYYRLRIVDLDDAEEFSKVIALDFENDIKEGLQSLFPIPAQGNSIFLKYNSVQGGRMDMEISTMGGQIIFREEVDLIAGSNLLGIDIETFLEGMYILNINERNKTESQRFTVIK